MQTLAAPHLASCARPRGPAGRTQGYYDMFRPHTLPKVERALATQKGKDFNWGRMPDFNAACTCGFRCGKGYSQPVQAEDTAATTLTGQLQSCSNEGTCIISIRFQDALAINGLQSARQDVQFWLPIALLEPKRVCNTDALV